MDFLVPICRVCHKLIEFDEKGTKRSPKDAFKQYQRLRQLAGRG
jgi:hypothetical protein